jgi:hypothetical protein
MWMVEYAGIVAAISLLAATLTGAYGQNVAAVFASGGAGVAAVTKAAHKEGVSTAGAKAAYKRAPYGKPALKYLYAVGWIGGTKNIGQCGLTLLGKDATKEYTEREMRSNAKLMAQLKRRAISAKTAAGAVVSGVVSACA